MKGVSLPINTMIIIILAVLVLTVVLFFFTSTTIGPMEIVRLKGEQARLCSSYHSLNPDCDATLAPDFWEDVCKRLTELGEGYACDSNTLACAKQCCVMFCGVGPDCVDDLGGECFPEGTRCDSTRPTPRTSEPNGYCPGTRHCCI